MLTKPRVIIAGGSGALGKKLAENFAKLGHEVLILTRRKSTASSKNQIFWDGENVEDSWASLIPNSILINLAGEIVDRRPTISNIELLKNSRVLPTKALVCAANKFGAPKIWLQMSTLAIYGDAGDLLLDESATAASWPEQMAGVATEWESALPIITKCRIVFMRTGIVFDSRTPALDRLINITKLGLGGTVSRGTQWVSWIHIKDFIAAINFIVGDESVSGVVHLTSPNPVVNKNLMAALRFVLKKPWSPPTPALVIRLGARFIFKTDPLLALTGRRAIPLKLQKAGFKFEHSEIVEALTDLCN